MWNMPDTVIINSEVVLPTGMWPAIWCSPPGSGTARRRKREPEWVRWFFPAGATNEIEDRPRRAAKWEDITEYIGGK